MLSSTRHRTAIVLVTAASFVASQNLRAQPDTTLGPLVAVVDSELAQQRYRSGGENVDDIERALSSLSVVWNGASTVVRISSISVKPDTPLVLDMIVAGSTDLVVIHYSAFESNTVSCIPDELDSPCNKTFFSFVRRLMELNIPTIIYSRYRGLCQGYRFWFYSQVVSKRPEWDDGRLLLLSMYRRNFADQGAIEDLQLLVRKTLEGTAKALPKIEQYCRVGT